MAEQMFCKACGAIDEPMTALVAELNETIKNLGIEVARKQGMITRLRRQGVKDNPAEYDDAMEVARYWKQMISPRAKELNGSRIANTIDRLQHGYDVATLKRSVWGYHCKPNVGKYNTRLRSSEGGKFKADLSFIMRDADLVDAGLRIADEEEHYDQGLLNDGASRHVAVLCECGHPRADHALYRFHGHDGCLRGDVHCRCEAFDDSLVLADHFRSAQEQRAQQEPALTHEQQMAIDPRCPPLPQGTLL